MASKTYRTQRNISDYSGLSDISHVYEIPDTYIGGAKKFDHKDWVLTENKLVEKNIDIPEGVQRVFLEILSNAGDNCDASRRAGVEPGRIEVQADDKKIIIKNYGLHIPVNKITLENDKGNSKVKPYQEGDVNWSWLPAFIFGSFRSSNNYDKGVKRMGCGRNGFGAKITNIFSKKFIVTVEDPDNKRRFEGIWRDNMFKDSPGTKPDITVTDDKDIKRGSVKVEWLLDFERFGMEKYKQEDLELFARYTADFSFACKIKTVFNETEFDFRNIINYASLTWSPEYLEKNITKYSWGNNPPEDIINLGQKAQEKKILEAKNPDHIPELEVLILDTPDKGKILSYVNGLLTKDGGVHVDAVLDPVCKYISNIVNGGKKKGKKNNTISINAKHIKSHLSFIINARVADPEYNSQSKTSLTAPKLNLVLTGQNLKKIQDWDVLNRLYAEMEAIAFKSASNTDGKKRKHVVMDKGEDANLAGTKESLKCKLYLVEGNSAANYPMKRICMIEGGKDYNGYMPLKGKFLNVTRARPSQYADNAVIATIKQIIGLREEVDYNLEHNLQQLRYGFIILTVDADDDGSHILAHVLNFFREKFPQILQRNMIGYLRTPLVKILKSGKIVHRFFTVGKFEKWKKETYPKGLPKTFTARYYKGLGTSNDDDIKDDIDYAPTLVCFYDSECENNFDLAFHKDNTHRRKDWIEKWRDATQYDDIISVDIADIIGKEKHFEKYNKKLLQAQDISQFLNRELISYSVASLFRAIPSQYDMLKESQRKALWAALEYFHYDPKRGKSIKVGRFSNKAADMTQYHHGEKSLIDTFIKMAQDFIGSNNMGYFKKDGQFGTRADGGENAADARYSETHLAWWLPFVYYRESIDLVEKRIVDDEETEPYWLPGVIPMGIVNGTNGIATAFSTTTPCHNPLDVIDWYRNKCKGQEPKPIVPWYNGFTGKLKIVNRDPSKNELQDELLPADIDSERPLTSPKRWKDVEDQEIEKLDQENLALLDHIRDSKLTLRTYGKYSIEGFHKNDGPIVKITELPIGTWIHRYRKWLELLVQQKGENRPIFDFKDNSTTEEAKFEIHWNSRYKPPNEANLKLIRSIGISNITLIDHHGFPIRFNNIQDVMERYYILMLEHYEKIRLNRIKIEEEKERDLSFRMKFIIHVLKGDIKIIKIKEEEVKKKMEEFSIPFEYYDKSKSRDFSQESLEKYKKQLEEAREKAKLAKETTSQQIWLEKLDILEKELRKRYKGKRFDMKK
jgi:DNA topoisomerase-2